MAPDHNVLTSKTQKHSRASPWLILSIVYSYDVRRRVLSATGHRRLYVTEVMLAPFIVGLTRSPYIDMVTVMVSLS